MVRVEVFLDMGISIYRGPTFRPRGTAFDITL